MKRKADGGKKRRPLPTPQLLIALGLVLCLAPLVSDLWWQHLTARQVTSLTDTAETMPDEERERLLAQARAYNARLGGYEDEGAEGIADGEILPYERQLSEDGDDAMGWIEIPRADITATIYHGVSEAVLAAGVGHQPETSLPVGGARSLCMLSGHSGMARFRVFDGIRVLEEGDVFALHVLGEVYAYRVIGWEIVDPGEVDATPRDGDTCVLVTCTTSPDKWNPKGRTGVNDKRLLVTGVRCAYNPAEFEAVEPAADVVVNDTTLPVIMAAGLVGAAGAAALALRTARRKRRSERHHAARHMKRG